MFQSVCTCTRQKLVIDDRSDTFLFIAFHPVWIISVCCCEHARLRCTTFSNLALEISLKSLIECSLQMLILLQTKQVIKHNEGKRDQIFHHSLMWPWHRASYQRHIVIIIRFLLRTCAQVRTEFPIGTERKRMGRTSLMIFRDMSAHCFQRTLMNLIEDRATFLAVKKSPRYS